MFNTLPLFSVLAIASTSLAAAILPRAGPSGSVNYPTGGTTITNYVGPEGQGTEWIYVDYTAVHEGTTANTIGLDLYLDSLDGSPLSFDPTIVNNFLAPTPASTDVVGWFVPPVGACGTYRLVFIEHQIYNNEIIQFRSAAPTITIDCVPYSG